MISTGNDHVVHVSTGQRSGLARLRVRALALPVCLVVLVTLLGSGAGAGAAMLGASVDRRTVGLDEISDPDGDASDVLVEVFGDRFAGTWVNHQTDGRRQVGLVDPVPGDAETARSALAGEDEDLVGEGIDIVPMTRSLAELEALRGEAVRLAQRAGVRSFAIGVDIVENVVDGIIEAGSWEEERLRPLRDLIEGSDGALVLELGTVSPLEGQPDNWPEICFVRLSYEVFLDRSPSTEEEQWWATYLLSRPPTAVGPAAIAFFFDLLVESDEWLGGTVAGLYEQALDRSPDPAGLAFWMGELRRGVRVNKVASFVFGSAELYSRAGGTDEGYVTQLYERILRRSPDGPGLAYWVEQVQATGLDSVAARFFDAYESRVSRVGVLYEKVLGRSLEAQGRAYWSERLLRMDDVRMAAQLATSAEFIYRSWGVCDPPVEVIPL